VTSWGSVHTHSGDIRLFVRVKGFY